MIGVPFYVMDFLEGHVVTDTLPPGLEDEDARRRLGLDLVDALVEIHAVDVDAPGVADFVRAGQLSRAAGTPLHAAVGDQPGRATSPTSRRSANGSPARCPSRCRSPSSTATTGSAT